MMAQEETMQIADLAKMPDDFAQHIHIALRSWHSQKLDDTLEDLLLARQIGMDQEGATPRRISNQVLLNGIERLRKSDEEAADILQSRFLNQETAQAVGFRRNLSEDIIFQRQRVAIEQLAEVIWGQERALVKQRKGRVEARLESPTYTKLFGVTEKLAEIRGLIESDDEPWLLSLEGMGGLGKTSLADALARQVAGSARFDEIGWVSARRRLFQFSGNESATDARPDLSLTELVDRLIEQFGLDGLAHVSDTEKHLGLKDFLKSHPCLVFVDNLETAADYSTFVLQLTGLAHPSKFVITTRYSLRDVSGVYIMPLKQLAYDDALALIRYEAKTRGLSELADAPDTDLEPIYTVTGGNPLAIKLLIGQVHGLSLSVALSRFGAVKGQTVDELLDFLYAAAWQSLDAKHRRALQAMLLVAEEGRLEQIAAAAELSEDEAAACLHRLTGLSLVGVSGSLHEKRYSLHQLAQAFVVRQS